VLVPLNLMAFIGHTDKRACALESYGVHWPHGCTEGSFQLLDQSDGCNSGMTCSTGVLSSRLGEQTHPFRWIAYNMWGRDHTTVDRVVRRCRHRSDKYNRNAHINECDIY
jgi:hypothetical protein